MADITYSHYHGSHKPEDRVKNADDREAARLVAAGLAVYSTKPEAAKAGADPETAATAK